MGSASNAYVGTLSVVLRSTEDRGYNRKGFHNQKTDVEKNRKAVTPYDSMVEKLDGCTMMKSSMVSKCKQGRTVLAQNDICKSSMEV